MQHYKFRDPDTFAFDSMQQLKKLPRNWRELCSQENEGNLLLILSLFLQAGKKFELCERLEKHLECCRIAALISVQLKGIQVHLAVAIKCKSVWVWKVLRLVMHILHEP